MEVRPKNLFILDDRPNSILHYFSVDLGLLGFIFHPPPQMALIVMVTSSSTTMTMMTRKTMIYLGWLGNQPLLPWRRLSGGWGGGGIKLRSRFGLVSVLVFLSSGFLSRFWLSRFCFLPWGNYQVDEVKKSIIPPLMLAFCFVSKFSNRTHTQTHLQFTPPSLWCGLGFVCCFINKPRVLSSANRVDFVA